MVYNSYHYLQLFEFEPTPYGCALTPRPNFKLSFGKVIWEITLEFS